MEQKEETMEKMGNWTCVLRELKMVDKNMELDLQSMLDNIKDMNIRDPWLLEQTIEDCRTCYAVSSYLNWYCIFQCSHIFTFQEPRPDFLSPLSEERKH